MRDGTIGATREVRKRIKNPDLRRVIIQATADLDMLICTLDDAVTTVGG
jgi:hypothetical protein